MKESTSLRLRAISTALSLKLFLTPDEYVDTMNKASRMSPASKSDGELADSVASDSAVYTEDDYIMSQLFYQKSDRERIAGIQKIYEVSKQLYGAYNPVLVDFFMANQYDGSTTVDANISEFIALKDSFIQ